MSEKEISRLNKDLGFEQNKKSKITRKKPKTTKQKSAKYTCSRCGRQGHNKNQCYAKTKVTGKPISTSKKHTQESQLQNKRNLCLRHQNRISQRMRDLTKPWRKTKIIICKKKKVLIILYE